MRLSLKNCNDPDAYIEIGLKGTMTAEKHKTERHGSTRSSANPHASSASTPGAPLAKSNAEEEELEKEQMMNIL